MPIQIVRTKPEDQPSSLDCDEEFATTNHAPDRRDLIPRSGDVLQSTQLIGRIRLPNMLGGFVRPFLHPSNTKEGLLVTSEILDTISFTFHFQMKHIGKLFVNLIRDRRKLGREVILTIVWYTIKYLGAT